jgi:hypothetical protein
MDIPTNGDELVDEAKKLAEIVAESELGKVILTDVADKANDMLNSVHERADAIGLGGVVDSVVNQVESKIGIDLDQDGDLGA